MISVNPSPSALGREHVLLRGQAHEYAAFSVDGPLSIKTVRRGRALWRAGSREWLVSPGRYLVLNAGETYDIEIDSAEPVETFCLFFRNGFAEDILRNHTMAESRLLDQPDLDQSLRPLQQTIAPLHSDLRRRLDRLSTNVHDGTDPTDDLALIALELTNLDRELRRRSERLIDACSATREETLRRVLRGRDLIESQWDERLGLDQIAAAAAMSPFHFHRRFRAAFGITPLEYLTRIRLEHARRLLRETSLSILEICLAIGFESQPTFTRLFRRRFGLPPGRYRSRFRKIR